MAFLREFLQSGGPSEGQVLSGPAICPGAGPLQGRGSSLGAPATSGWPGPGRAPSLRPPPALPWGDLRILPAATSFQQCESGFSPWLGFSPWFCHPRIRPTASAPAVPRKEHLAFRGAASCPGPSTLWGGALLFPQLGSGVHVFGRLSLRAMAVS